QLALAEIDALGEVHHRALRAQPPADAAGEPQQRRGAVLRQRGLHRGMQMEADGEALSGAALEPVLAAQILAIGGEEELAVMDEAEARRVAVMARLQPMRALLLGALAQDIQRPPADPVAVADLGRVGVGDDQRRMRRGGARDAPPLGTGSMIGAAIDDEPLASVAQLEGKRAGMRL